MKAKIKIPSTVLAGGRVIKYPSTRMMGVINATPDSFYAGSRSESVSAVLKSAEKFLACGADFLDIGGQSSRPWSRETDEKTERLRLIAAVGAVRKRFPKAVISADTYRASCAAAAIDCGADIINDISALTFDPEMVSVAARSKVPVILMHTRGKPRDMQKNTGYKDAPSEVLAWLKSRADFAREGGIPARKIIIDPGIGFAKLPEHNFALLRRIDEFFQPGYPVLVGHSRKIFIGILLGSEDAPLPPDSRLSGTLAVTAYLASRGTHIVRVHDAEENAAVLKLSSALWRQSI
ncbi:MAG: dihydropteroate synthase [Elusimicrobiales bacterium]